MKTNTIYFMATYYKKPARPYSTSNHGFGADPNNFKYDEQISVSRTLKKRDHMMCQIILDIPNRTVVKNSMNPGQPFDEVYAYFKEHYPKYIEIIEQGISGPLTSADFASTAQA